LRTEENMVQDKGVFVFRGTTTTRTTINLPGCKTTFLSWQDVGLMTTKVHLAL